VYGAVGRHSADLAGGHRAVSVHLLFYQQFKPGVLARAVFRNLKLKQAFTRRGISQGWAAIGQALHTEDGEAVWLCQVISLVFLEL
jgi:hypothetical protein